MKIVFILGKVWKYLFVDNAKGVEMREEKESM